MVLLAQPAFGLVHTGFQFACHCIADAHGLAVRFLFLRVNLIKIYWFLIAAQMGEFANVARFFDELAEVGQTNGLYFFFHILLSSMVGNNIGNIKG